MKLAIFLRLFIFWSAVCNFLPARAQAGTSMPGGVTLHTSTQQEALTYLDQYAGLTQSSFWPNVKPDKFLANVRTNVENPLSMYPGRGTNFCGYGALSYLFLHDDPLGYARFLVELYQQGKAKLGRVSFNPSASIKKAAGRLRYKGILDIRPAEQLFYLTLADEFKGYVNIFNHNYDPGDEDTFWASVNYAKFNRMVRKLLHYKVHARGADIIRPSIDDLYTYVSEKINTGTVALYINNRLLHKKNHNEVSVAIPTHFLILEKITRSETGILLIYWDYGGRTQVEVSDAFFKKIVFGITVCTKENND